MKRACLWPCLSSLLVAVAIGQAGCGSELDSGPENTGPAPGVPEGQPPIAEPPQEGTGFPCDVHAVLQKNCAACHAGRLYYGPNFASRDDLFLPARDLYFVHQEEVGPGTFGEHMAVVLRDDTMPPYGTVQRPSPAEREIVIAWLAAGMPAGACGTLTASP
jgi:mono/diheme cytochrome c family protein